MGSNLDLPEPKWRGRLEQNRGSGILQWILPDPPDPPDPGNPGNPGNPAEMVSGAAVQTLPNHAQESQDDVSSQANSLKLAWSMGQVDEEVTVTSHKTWRFGWGVSAPPQTLPSMRRGLRMT